MVPGRRTGYLPAPRTCLRPAQRCIEDLCTPVQAGDSEFVSACRVRRLVASGGPIYGSPDPDGRIIGLRVGGKEIAYRSDVGVFIQASMLIEARTRVHHTRTTTVSPSWVETPALSK